MSYRADKQVIDTHTHGHTDRHTDEGDDNTRRPKLASGNKSDPTKDPCAHHVIPWKFMYDNVIENFETINLEVLEYHNVIIK